MKKYINAFKVKKNGRDLKYYAGDKGYKPYNYEVAVYNNEKLVKVFKLDNVIERGLRSYKSLKVRK